MPFYGVIWVRHEYHKIHTRRSYVRLLRAYNHLLPYKTLRLENATDCNVVSLGVTNFDDIRLYDNVTEV